MIVYKFRTAEQLPYALDILYNRRLYCADWSTLNDPMEGSFYFQASSADAERVKSGIEEVIAHKRRLRVASLAATLDCHLLWAHYAAGFTGLAVEVELPDKDRAIRRVNYRGVFAELRMSPTFSAEVAAQAVLSSKYLEWAYEREVRVLQQDEWYPLRKPVRRIIVGHRIDEGLFRGITAICKDAGIPLYRTGIGDEKIVADLIWMPRPHFAGFNTPRAPEAH